MTWTFNFKDRRLNIRDKQILGRADFAGCREVSRKHLEILLREGQVCIKDLGSSYGTFIDNQRLEKDVFHQLREGQILHVGSLEVHLVHSAFALYEPSSVKTWALPLTVIVLAGATFLRPGMGYGKALGLYGFSIILFTLFAAVLAMNQVWFFTLRRPLWTARQAVRFFLAVLLSSGALAFVLLVGEDLMTSVHKIIIQEKIEYFCASHFERAQCVYHVNLCPTCAHHLDRWERLIMVEKLKASQVKLEAEIKTLPPARLPANH